MQYAFAVDEHDQSGDHRSQGSQHRSVYFGSFPPEQTIFRRFAKNGAFPTRFFSQYQIHDRRQQRTADLAVFEGVVVLFAQSPVE
jgi:hypothetical protein